MRIHVTVAALAALMAVPAAAQQAPREITFQEAIDIALRQSSAIARSENQQTLNQIAVSDARSRFVPDLRLSTSGAQDLRHGAGDANRSMSMRVSSSVTVFDGFANIAGVRGAEAQREAGEQSAERTRQDVVFNVISGFLSLVEAREQVGVAEENLAAQLQREAEVQLLVDRNSRPIADLYSQQAAVASARASLVDAERNREMAEVTLIQTLRLDAADDYEFIAPPPANPDTSVLNVTDLVETALQMRPDLAALAYQEQAAEQQVRSARSARLPNVSLSFGYGTSYNTGSTLPFSEQLDNSRSGSVSVGLSFPLWDVNAASRSVQRANVQRANARLALEDARQQVTVEVRRALLDRESAIVRLAAAEARVESAQRALEATEARYQAGVATLFEVTQARTSFVDASSALVSARNQRLYQDQVLAYYTGSLQVPSTF